jgi:anti-sigma factor RsiW
MSWQPEPADWPTLKRDPSDADEHVRDLLPAYLNGTIAPSEVGRIGDHLERCAGCREAARSWEAIAGAVRASATPQSRPPTRLLDRAMAAIRDADGSSDDATGVPTQPLMNSPGNVAAMPATPWRPPATRRRPIVADISLAAVFVLVLAGIVAAFRLAPDDDRLVVPDAAHDATPTSGASATARGQNGAITGDECAITPRPTDGAANGTDSAIEAATVLSDPLSVLSAPTVGSIPGVRTPCAN